MNIFKEQAKLVNKTIGVKLIRVYTVRLTGISKEGRMEELLNQILIQLRIITVALIFVSILMIIHKIN